MLVPLTRTACSTDTLSQSIAKPSLHTSNIRPGAQKTLSVNLYVNNRRVINLVTHTQQGELR